MIYTIKDGSLITNELRLFYGVYLGFIDGRTREYNGKKIKKELSNAPEHNL